VRQTRVYVDLPLAASQDLALPAPAVQHLVQVLRLRPGDDLILFNGDGPDYPATILTAHRQGVLIRTGEPGEPEPALPLRVHLGIGISKGERMDFSIQKAVELGVAEITPLFAGRGMVRLAGDRLAKRQEHWQGILIAACEQSGRRRLPMMNPAQNLETWVAQGHPCPLLLDHRASRSLPSLSPPGPALTLLIGPEGGLAPAERERTYHSGFTGVRLGPRILRTETAPLAALAIVQALWGDLKDVGRGTIPTHD
jgi:16S rRNA (uracil1498-N3)-methyltransferase